MLQVEGTGFQGSTAVSTVRCSSSLGSTGSGVGVGAGEEQAARAMTASRANAVRDALTLTFSQREREQKATLPQGETGPLERSFSSRTTPPPYRMQYDERRRC